MTTTQFTFDVRLKKIADVKYIKHCACCGKFLPKLRWMIVGGYDYNQNKRPICWDCDASYE